MATKVLEIYLVSVVETVIPLIKGEVVMGNTVTVGVLGLVKKTKTHKEVVGHLIKDQANFIDLEAMNDQEADVWENIMKCNSILYVLNCCNDLTLKRLGKVKAYCREWGFPLVVYAPKNVRNDDTFSTVKIFLILEDIVLTENIDYALDVAEWRIKV